MISPITTANRPVAHRRSDAGLDELDDLRPGRGLANHRLHQGVGRLDEHLTQLHAEVGDDEAEHQSWQQVFGLIADLERAVPHGDGPGGDDRQDEHRVEHHDRPVNQGLDLGEAGDVR
jgi:hypothetical protein